uniref:Uncharacterized protein n=1 Tax=Globisporangium ultimum (strain ATCC 200006 / CBS 805.95 / DAOM BR144) TaxID=431595 RepID=K3W9F6_GLOUD
MNRHSLLPKKSILQENRDLRRLVNKQRKFTQEFGEKLCQSAEKVPSKFDLISDSDPVPARLTDADLACYYEALAGKLDSLYAQLSHVLATSRAKIDKRRREATHALIVRNCDTNAMTLQFHHHKILPFDFQSSCDAIWKCLRDEAVSGSERGDEVVLPREDNLILMKKTILVESPDGRGHSEIKLPLARGQADAELRVD